MALYGIADSILIAPMLQLAEKETNSVEYKSMATRKALALPSRHASVSNPGPNIGKDEPKIPCWVEDQQSVCAFPVSVANTFDNTGNALLPGRPTTSNPLKHDKPSPASVIFPLSSDHLIVLLQFNVLRACLVNRQLLSSLIGDYPRRDCSLPVLQIHLSPTFPQLVPPSLEPTALQRMVPHKDWVDIIPDPKWRDDVILATGQYNEEELWSDTISGLFKGFPASECVQQGIIAWSPPWHISGWEVSEGFLQKWAWSLKGCKEVLESTNLRRRERGEEPLHLEV